MDLADVLVGLQLGRALLWAGGRGAVEELLQHAVSKGDAILKKNDNSKSLLKIIS